MAVEIFKTRHVMKAGISAVMRSASLNGAAMIYRDTVPAAIVIPVDDVGKENFKKYLNSLESVVEKGKKDDSWNSLLELIEDFNRLHKVMKI